MERSQYAKKKTEKIKLPSGSGSVDDESFKFFSMGDMTRSTLVARVNSNPVCARQKKLFRATLNL